MKIRVGFGYDVHRLTNDRLLILGGVEIPFHKGLTGHSDADVLIHAICDALLGAAGLRDIGFHFPNTDMAFKDADSKMLLKKVVELLQEKNWKVSNIDATICAEEPKISPHIPLITKTLATLLQIDSGDVSVKAGTNEKMGFVGREEGMAAYAVALIHQ